MSRYGNHTIYLCAVNHLKFYDMTINQNGTIGKPITAATNQKQMTLTFHECRTCMARKI